MDGWKTGKAAMEAGKQGKCVAGDGLKARNGGRGRGKGGAWTTIPPTPPPCSGGGGPLRSLRLLVLEP